MGDTYSSTMYGAGTGHMHRYENLRSGGSPEYQLHPSWKNICVIAVRGTDDLSDMRHDVDDGVTRVWFAHTKFGRKRLKIKQGFYDATDLVATEAARWFRDCSEVYYTGHSLGGVVASILGMSFGPKTYRGTGNGGTNIYTFGALPFVKNSLGKAYAGGFRLYHTLDFAPNMDDSADNNWQHVGGSHRIYAICGFSKLAPWADYTWTLGNKGNPNRKSGIFDGGFGVAFHGIGSTYLQWCWNERYLLDTTTRRIPGDDGFVGSYTRRWDITEDL